MPALLDAGSPPGTPPQPKNSLRAFVLALTLRRVGATLLMAVLAALIISPIFVTPTLVLVGRFMVIALVLVLLFTAAGVWRQRWVPTWVLQLVVVLAAAPLMTFVVYLPSVGGDIKEVFNHEGRAQGFVSITASTMFWGALLVMGALFREREARSRSAELSFALEEPARTSGRRRPAQADAGADRTAFPVQYACQCAGPGGVGLAARGPGAGKPDRVPARHAPPERRAPHARRRSAWCVPTSS